MFNSMTMCNKCNMHYVRARAATELATATVLELKAHKKSETRKRTTMVAQVLDQCSKSGRYKFEGLDVAVVENGVVAYELEPAQNGVGQEPVS